MCADDDDDDDDEATHPGSNVLCAYGLATRHPHTHTHKPAEGEGCDPPEDLPSPSAPSLVKQRTDNLTH